LLLLPIGPLLRKLGWIACLPLADCMVDALLLEPR